MLSEDFFVHRKNIQWVNTNQKQADSPWDYTSISALRKGRVLKKKKKKRSMKKYQLLKKQHLLIVHGEEQWKDIKYAKRKTSKALIMVQMPNFRTKSKAAMSLLPTQGGIKAMRTWRGKLAGQARWIKPQSHLMSLCKSSDTQNLIWNAYIPSPRSNVP